MFFMDFEIEGINLSKISSFRLFLAVLSLSKLLKS